MDVQRHLIYRYLLIFIILMEYGTKCWYFKSGGAFFCVSLDILIAFRLITHSSASQTCIFKYKYDALFWHKLFQF